ncbi:MAG: ATP-binding protein [Burkholderiaceae bacterium]
MGLSRFITENIDSILEEFVAFAREQLPAAATMNFEALRDHARQVLDAIALDMRQPQTLREQREKSMGHAPPNEGAQTAAETHGVQRAAVGFDVKQTAAEYRALRASVLRLWFKTGPELGRDAIFEMVRFNEAMDEALAESILFFSDEAARMRNLFLGVLSHELRTPLSTIKMSGQSLLIGASQTNSMTGVAERVMRASGRIESVLDDLLDYVRSGLGEGMRVSPTALDMGLVCERIVAELRANHPARTLDLALDGDLHCVCDEQRISQAISNLVGNAVNYSGGDAEVAIRASGSDAAEIVITVRNFGKPIPDETCESLFEPLVRGTGQAGGGYNLGLGLYVVREIVQAHGGKASASSSQEAGTVFTLRLPRDRDSRSTPAFQGIRMS